MPPRLAWCGRRRAELHAGSLWRLRYRPAQYLAFVAGIIAASAGACAWIDGPGIVGLVLPMSGAEYFGETIGVPIVLLATGVLLIVLMVLLLHRGTGHRPLLP